MKKLAVAFILCLCLFFALSVPAFALEIDADACILIDAGSGRIIYQQNAHESLPPASTTKVLTALLVLQNEKDLQRVITLPDDFVNVGESGIYLEAGEKHTVEDLLYALMLKSANDAAQALAIGVSGNEPAFVKYMNDYIKELGLADSTWQNPHGLHDDNHLTSVYDLAMITREAAKIPLFNEIITTDSWSMPWTGNVYDRQLFNSNQFLDRYEGADGVKTGYTSISGNCLVASATRDGMRLIGVVFNCPEFSHYDQMIKLMDYGFDSYQPLQLASAGDVLGTVRIKKGDVRSVEAAPASDVVIAMPKGTTFQPEPKITLESSLVAPLSIDQAVGTVSYTDDMGNTVEVPLYAKEQVNYYVFADILKSVWQRFVNVFF